MAEPPADKPRRFYRSAAVQPEGEGFAVALDGRVAKTPSGARLVLPNAALAALLVAEWEAQAEVIDAARMPATRLAFTVIDKGGQARDGLAEEAARYAGSDLLCYRAEAPDALIRMEAVEWDPWLDWAARELGVTLAPTAGIIHRPQPPEALERMKALALELDDFALTALAQAAALLGSAVLAFALQRGALAGEAALEVSRVDERFQIERWGLDYEAADRLKARQADARLLQAWFEALRTPA